jgi:hypothetical protein
VYPYRFFVYPKNFEGAVKFLLTFETIGAAFDFQALVKGRKNQYGCKIIPTPRRLGVSCSYSVVFACEQEHNGIAGKPELSGQPFDVFGFLRAHSVSCSKVFQIVNKNGTEVYEECKR